MTIQATSAIRAHLASGAIVCDPAPRAIEGAHIDITLGCHFWRRVGPPAIIDLRHADPLNYYQEGCARPGGIIELPAWGRLLCHTEEFIGTAKGSNLLPMLDTRSTPARWFISVHQAAGVGDEGYVSRWTLEIANPTHDTFYLPVGGRVGSLQFQRTEGSAAPYEGRYNTTRAEWTPADMLPKRGNW
jgi:dCTP deaminase